MFKCSLLPPFCVLHFLSAEPPCTITALQPPTTTKPKPSCVDSGTDYNTHDQRAPRGGLLVCMQAILVLNDT